MRAFRLSRIVPAAFLLAAGLLLGAALPGPADKPQAKAPAAPPSADPSAGELLIASAQIRDPRFYHAVILLVRHDAKGAFGIVINKPLGEQPIAVLLAAAAGKGQGGAKGGGPDAGIKGTIRVFEGGPVQPELGFIVHSPDYRRAETTTVDHIVAVTPTIDTLRDIGHHKGPRKYFFALGYAGWGAGQLEAEMARHDWFTTPADEALIFDADRAALWRKALQLRTREL
ncbi:MAG: YqgE/AlgH family protein [Stellaceae bacterium]